MGKVLKGFMVIGLVAISVMVIGADPAQAAAPVLNAPERVYTLKNVPIAFTGTDAISDDDKAITTTATSAGCAPADPLWSLTGCARIQMLVTHGEIQVTQVTDLTDPGDPNGIATGGAIIESSTNDDGSGLAVNLNGTAQQLTDALATLTFTPDTDYVNGNSDPAPAHLDIKLVDGDSGGNGSVDKQVEIRVDELNVGPTLTVPGNQTATASTPIDIPAVAPPLGTNGEFSVEDPDVEGFETDDVMLVVMFTTCGTFHLRGGSFTIDDDLTSLLTNSPVNLDPTIAAAIIAALPPEVTGQAFATSNPFTDKTGFAALGSLDEVNYGLSQVTYTPPAAAASCDLWTIVSDLGNNGMPLKYVGSPIGGADQPQPGYEAPDLGLDFDIVNFTVDGGVTVDVPSSIAVTEGDTAQIPVSVSSASHPAFDVADLAVDISATGGGVDYDAPTSPLSYPLNDGGPLNLSAATKTDGGVEGPETFSVTISLPDMPPGVTVGNATTVVTIEDANEATTTTAPSTTAPSSSTTVPSSTTSPNETTTTTSTTEPATTVPSSTTSPNETTTTTSTTEPATTVPSSTTEPSTTTTTSTTEPATTVPSSTTEPSTTTTTSTTEPATTVPSSTTSPNETTTTTSTTEPATTVPSSTTEGQSTTTTDGSTTTTGSETTTTGGAATTTLVGGSTSTTGDVSGSTLVTDTTDPGGTSGGGLARTGFSLQALLVVGLSLLLVGLASTKLSRSRR